MANAYQELFGYLRPNEIVEAIVFGPWGWDGYEEPDPPPVPHDLRGSVLTEQAAKPLMQTWSFFGGHGAPMCYAAYIWTNERVIWVTQYDGATDLDSAPRNPAPIIPNMSGG